MFLNIGQLSLYCCFYFQIDYFVLEFEARKHVHTFNSKRVCTAIDPHEWHAKPHFDTVRLHLFGVG